MLSIKNTITAAQETTDYFGWTVFLVKLKNKISHFLGCQKIASFNLDEVREF